jgi:hypothetical protein
LPAEKASVHVHQNEQSREEVQLANGSHDNQQALFKPMSVRMIDQNETPARLTIVLTAKKSTSIGKSY